ncbi:MAG: hypothetical protein QM740_04300 [Acidovorax sp.]
MHPDLHRHRFAPGQERLLSLPEGSELFCRRGTLRLSCPAQGLVWAVPPGQGWRAAEDMWVLLAAAGGEAAEAELHEAAQTATSRWAGLAAAWARWLGRAPRGGILPAGRP